RAGRRVASRRSRLHDRDDEADRRQDVADAHTLGFRADLDHGSPGVVHLPGQLPALGLAAADRLLKLLHDLLERVAVAVVKNRHPRRGDGFLVDWPDTGFRCGLLDHSLDYSSASGMRPRAPAEVQGVSAGTARALGVVVKAWTAPGS